MKIKSIEITRVRLVLDDTTIEVEEKPARQVKKPAEVRVHEPKAKPATDKRPRHLWTDEEKREAMRMYAEGVDMDTIVKKFDSTPWSVQKIMNKNGIRRPWPTKGNPSQIKTDEPKEEPV